MINSSDDNNQKRAYRFYEKHFHEKNREYVHNKILNHLEGIDFKDVKTFDDNFSLATGKIVTQWKALSISQGDYYADKKKWLNFMLPRCLGIHDEQEEDKERKIISKRIEHYFEVQTPIVVLRSTAASVVDTWSINKDDAPDGFKTTCKKLERS